MNTETIIAAAVTAYLLVGYLLGVVAYVRQLHRLARHEELLNEWEENEDWVSYYHVSAPVPARLAAVVVFALWFPLLVVGALLACAAGTARLFFWPHRYFARKYDEIKNPPPAKKGAFETAECQHPNAYFRFSTGKTYCNKCGKELR